MEFLPILDKLIQYHIWLPKLGFAILILFGYWIGNLVVRKILKFILLRAKVNHELVSILIDSILWLVIWLIAFVTIFDYFGLDVTGALAGIGFLGVAIGFAARDSLGNIIAGMMIFWDKPFQVGEWIEIEGRLGQVKHITVRSTRIRTLDNTYIIIPNQTIINSPLINHSAYGATRVKIEIGIGYNQAIDLARKTLLKLPKNIETILKDPEPDVIVSSFGESAIELQLRVWIDDVRNERAIRFELQEQISKAFNKAGIEIPYPTRTVFMKK